MCIYIYIYCPKYLDNFKLIQTAYRIEMIIYNIIHRLSYQGKYNNNFDLLLFSYKRTF